MVKEGNMSKYNCEKTRDFMHEWIRYHKAPGNDKFPIITSWEPASIEALQKWSDEHPEAPKLTRKEHDFLTSFDGHALNIERRSSDRLYVVQHSPVDVNTILIDPNSFPFINVGEIWYFTKLLNLDVEDE